jgi:hypothetical protein
MIYTRVSQAYVGRCWQLYSCAPDPSHLDGNLSIPDTFPFGKAILDENHYFSIESFLDDTEDNAATKTTF